MLKKTLRFSVVVATVSTLLQLGLCFSVLSRERDDVKTSDNIKNVAVENVVILGQNHTQSHSGQNHGGHRTNQNQTVGGWFKTTFSRIFQDDTVPEQRPVQVVIPPATPTIPPRPLTAAEIQEAQANTSRQQVQRSAANQRSIANDAGTTAARRGTLMTNTRTVIEDEGRSADGERSIQDNDRSVHARMAELRRSVFDSPTFEDAAKASRQMSNASRGSASGSSASRTLSPSPSRIEQSRTPQNVLEQNVSESPQIPAESSEDSVLSGLARHQEIGVSTTELPLMPSVEYDLLSRSTALPTVTDAFPITSSTTGSNPASSSLESGQGTPVAAEAVPQQRSGRQTVVSVSPRLEYEIEKPETSVVGEEITYRIEVRNVGEVPAERVVLTGEFPSWIEIRQAESTNGNIVVQPREDGSGIAHVVWETNRIEQGTHEMVLLRLIPQQRQAIEPFFRLDFLPPRVAARVEVQEPRIEMELIGADDILWNQAASYTLIVRNVGNGSADNLTLTLQQSNSPNAKSVFEEPLRPGDEHAIGITVEAVRAQEFVDIAVVAEGSHALRSEVKRRIKVLRPVLEMHVHTLPVQLVENPAEFVIRILNVGNARAEQITIRAELPLGTQYLSSSEGGIYTIYQHQNIVEWRGQTIEQGEARTFTLNCVPKREGENRITVEASEPQGSVMVAGNRTFTAEAITELEMILLRPQGPVELGQKNIEYTVQVTNVGTKTAEKVDILVAFGDALDPHGVFGGEATVHNGLVAFEQIPMILPKQRIERKIFVEAKTTGTVQVKALVERGGTDLRLENTVATTIFNRQKPLTTASGQTVPQL